MIKSRKEKPTFIVLRKHLVIVQFSFFLFCHRLPLLGKPRETPVSFVKTTESYEISLVTINRQTSDDSDILR